MLDAESTPAVLASLPDDALLEAVQRQTFRFFWEGAHPVSGLALDRHTKQESAGNDRATIGGTGFGIMSIIVAAERRWVTRAAAVERLGRILDFLAHTPRYHGAFPHFVNGRTGATISFSRKDDGGDLVETALLFAGWLCAREYFNQPTPKEIALRDRVTALWHEVEWNWYTRGGRAALYWHWSPKFHWAMNLEIRGWNEGLIAYILAASSPRHPIEAAAYHRGFAAGPNFRNGNSYLGIPLPLGPPYAGPLSFAQYSFMGLDPCGLADRYADYWEQCQHHVRIVHAYCDANPARHKGYSGSCWGITASDDPTGYLLHAPGPADDGTIAPTAAIASMPFAPRECLEAVRYFLRVHGGKLWGRFGFVDAFCDDQDWCAESFVAIDQGPIVVMIENYRSGLLWKLLTNQSEVRAGLATLGFTRKFDE